MSGFPKGGTAGLVAGAGITLTPPSTVGVTPGTLAPVATTRPVVRISQQVGADPTGVADSTAAVAAAVASLTSNSILVIDGLFRCDTVGAPYLTQTGTVNTTATSNVVTVTAGFNPSLGQAVSIPGAGTAGATFTGTCLGPGLVAGTFLVDTLVPTSVTGATCTATATAIVRISGLTGIDVVGAGYGAASGIFATTAVATELVRVEGCPDFRCIDGLIYVQGTAQVFFGFHNTTSVAAQTIHKQRITNLQVYNKNGLARVAPYSTGSDITAVAGSNLLTSVTKQWAAGDVGGVVMVRQAKAFPLIGKVTAAATQTATLNGTLATGATSVTLNGAIPNQPTTTHYMQIGTGAGLEMVKVTAGFGTTTLTIARAQMGTAQPASWASGTTVTIWQATLAVPAQETVHDVPMGMANNGQAMMVVGIGKGCDWAGASTLDLARDTWGGGCRADGSLIGYLWGNGTQGNLLNVNGTQLSGLHCCIGILNNGASLSVDSAVDFSENGVAFQRILSNTDPIRYQPGRMENCCELWVDLTSSTSATETALRDFFLVSMWRPDGQVVSHTNSGHIDIGPGEAYSGGYVNALHFALAGSDSTHLLGVFGRNVSYFSGTSNLYTFSNCFGVVIPGPSVSSGAKAIGGPVQFIGAQGATLADGSNIAAGTTTGTKIGTVGGSAGQKIGFWNATPVVQPVLATGAAHTVDDVITYLQTLGLARQS